MLSQTDPDEENFVSPRDASADELAIRNLVARYADAVNRRDQAEWAGTWCEDGVWELLGQHLAGREPVMKFWNAAMASLKFVVQEVHAGFVVVEGDEGKGRFTMTERAVSQQGDRTLMSALYHDRYRFEAGTWRFAARRLEVLYHGPPDLSGPLP